MNEIKHTTSIIEIQDLIKAWLAISIAFAIVLGRGDIFTSKFLVLMLFSGFTVGLGFLLHEMAHKFVAQQYGCFAEFRAFDMMLLLAVAMSFLGFVFVAPGAVFISGHVTRKKNGIISAIGPLTNFVLAVIFFGIFIITTGIVHQFAAYGFTINAWIGLFNMIPFFNFDGSKIFMWSKTIYGAMVLIAIGLFALQFI